MFLCQLQLMSTQLTIMLILNLSMFNHIDSTCSILKSKRVNEKRCLALTKMIGSWVGGSIVLWEILLSHQNCPAKWTHRVMEDKFCRSLLMLAKY